MSDCGSLLLGIPLAFLVSWSRATVVVLRTMSIRCCRWLECSLNANKHRNARDGTSDDGFGDMDGDSAAM